jgi:hypothetical protein
MEEVSELSGNSLINSYIQKIHKAYINQCHLLSLPATTFCRDFVEYVQYFMQLLRKNNLLPDQPSEDCLRKLWVVKPAGVNKVLSVFCKELRHYLCLWTHKGNLPGAGLLRLVDK